MNRRHRGSKRIPIVLLVLVSLCAACGASHSGSPSPLKASATPLPATPTTAPPSPSASPTFAPTPTVACARAAGELQRLEFTDPVMTSFKIPVNVYLPPCYSLSADRFPVAYLLHGYPQDQEHWLQLGLQNLLDARISQESWPGFIAVMPLQPDPYFTRTDGGPGSLEQVVVEGLIPFVDDKYRTIPEARARALIGISRGGVWALEIGLRHPGLFQTVAALSPALSVNHPRPEYDPGLIVRQGKELPVRIWISVGDSEPSFQVGIDRLAQILDQERIDYTYVHSTGRHEDAAWKLLLEPLFDFVLAPWSTTGP